MIWGAEIRNPSRCLLDRALHLRRRRGSGQVSLLARMGAGTWAQRRVIRKGPCQWRGTFQLCSRLLARTRMVAGGSGGARTGRVHAG